MNERRWAAQSPGPSWWGLTQSVIEHLESFADQTQSPKSSASTGLLAHHAMQAQNSGER